LIFILRPDCIILVLRLIKYWAESWIVSSRLCCSFASIGDNAGTVTWDFSVNDTDVDYLAVGESLEQSYAVAGDYVIDEFDLDD